MEEAAGGYQTLMNKWIITVALIVSIASCAENPHKKKTTGNDSTNIITAVTADLIAPDSTINNTLKLGNSLSASSFFPHKIKLLDSIRESPVAVFKNATKDKYLMAYHYEGSSENQFSVFEIGYVKRSAPYPAHIVRDNDFITESGVRLGLKRETLLRIKGNDFESDLNSSKDTVIRYRIADYQHSPFCKRYNMPGYFYECTFKNGLISLIRFGFYYP